MWPLTTTTFLREQQPLKRCLSICWLSGKLWYLKHSCVGDAIIYQQFCLYFWNHYTVYPVTIVAVKSKIAAANMNTQAPVPLSIFRSNSKFDENSNHSSVKYTRPITTIFCTRHDSATVVTCAKYRCDRSSIFETRAFWIFIEFRIRSKYA